MVAVCVAIEAVHRLRARAHNLTPSVIAYVVLGASILVDIVRSRALLKVAKETKSEALAADALHFSSDLVSSALVLLGLVAVQFGFPQADAIAAIAVAVFITVAGYRLGQRTIDTLMDAAPPGLSKKIRNLAGNISGVTSVDAVRVRAVGTDVFAEVVLGVARTFSQDRIAMIKRDVTEAAQREFPNAVVTLATMPKAMDDETILERVLHVAAVHRRPVHHVTVQHIGDRLAVSFDLEVDGRLSLKEGHAIASDLEQVIAAELGPGVEVETHLEPLDVQGIHGQDAPGDQLDHIRVALISRASQDGFVREIHDVRARATEVGLVVNFHCTMSAECSIAEMHTHVDDIERALRKDMPEIVRVVGHAEPERSVKRPSA